MVCTHPLPTSILWPASTPWPAPAARPAPIPWRVKRHRMACTDRMACAVPHGLRRPRGLRPCHGKRRTHDRRRPHRLRRYRGARRPHGFAHPIACAHPIRTFNPAVRADEPDCRINGRCVSYKACGRHNAPSGARAARLVAPSNRVVPAPRPIKAAVSSEVLGRVPAPPHKVAVNLPMPSTPHLTLAAFVL